MSCMSGTGRMIRALRFLPVLLAGFLPAACGSLEQPFAKTDNPALVQNRPPAPAIALSLSDEVPAGRALKLREALKTALRRRGLGLGSGGGWPLKGEFEPYRDETGRRRLAYVFRLFRPDGSSVVEVSGSEPLKENSPDPWAGIDHVAVTRIAETVAEGLSARLAALGYGTQGAGLPPPPDTLVEAGPDADRELDPDLLAGLPVPGAPVRPVVPGAVPPVASAPPSAGNAAARGRAGVADVKDAKDVKDGAGKGGRKAATGAAEPDRGKGDGRKGAVRISTVAVTGVTGAPGRGNRELAEALRAVLRKAGWPVYRKPRRDSMSIAGRVEMGPKRKGGQRVRIAWTVKSPSGRVLGVIRQENTVEPGSLDAGFGPAAGVVAEAAADGIFQLVRKLR